MGEGELACTQTLAQVAVPGLEPGGNDRGEAGYQGSGDRGEGGYPGSDERNRNGVRELNAQARAPLYRLAAFPPLT